MALLDYAIHQIMPGLRGKCLDHYLNIVVCISASVFVFRADVFGLCING